MANQLDFPWAKFLPVIFVPEMIFLSAKFKTMSFYNHKDQYGQLVFVVVTVGAENNPADFVTDLMHLEPTQGYFKIS